LEYKSKFLNSFDGTRIGYQTAGKGRPVVLANGLGGRIAAYHRLIEHFKDRCKFICWDYRGLYDSAIPEDPTQLAIEDHARDLNEILKKERIRKAILVGWSMGSQVILEFYRNHAPKVDGFVVINGTYGTPFETAFNRKISRYLIPLALSYAITKIDHIEPIIHWAAGKRFVLPLLKTIGMVGKTTDKEVFVKVAGDFVRLDLNIYIDIFKNLGSHTAEYLLHKIDVPTLIVSGDRDFFTPLVTARCLADKIPKSELFIIPKGTHYAAIEFPGLLNKRLDKFFKENFNKS